MLSRHLVGCFIGVPRRDKPGVLLLPAAMLAQLDLVYLHPESPPRPDLIPAFEIGFCDKNLTRTRALHALWRGRAVGQVTARAIVLDFMQPQGAGRRLQDARRHERRDEPRRQRRHGRATLVA